MATPKPEAHAREAIDAALVAAGWVVQDLDDLNLAAGRGVAARELRMAEGHGRADYLLFVDGQAVGALEAKKAGHTLTGVEGQARKYGEGLPDHIEAPLRPLPFLYVSNGVETKLTNRLDPEARARTSSHPTVRRRSPNGSPPTRFLRGPRAGRRCNAERLRSRQ